MIRIDITKKNRDFKKLDIKDGDFISLSIDQASTKSGYSIMVNGKLEVYGLIKAKGNSIDRLFMMTEVVEYLIDKYHPNFIGLENVQYQSNPQTLILLSKLLGMLENLCHSKKIEYIVIAPKTWKSICGIKGRKRKEQKENTINFVKENYQIEVIEDIADAISINHYIKEVIWSQ